MKCKKCGQWIVRLEDGTPDCGCYVETDNEYPSVERDSDGFHTVRDEGLSEG